MPDETTLRNAEEPVALLADEAIDDNPDEQTRRETFELDLMAEGRSREGSSVNLEDQAKHHEH
jgi:hypothetical protein